VEADLAGAQSPAELAKEVRKRLTIIARSRSFVDWQGIRSLADDLGTQRRAIVETVAKADPTEALDLLWRFMALASSIFERCDDRIGLVGRRGATMRIPTEVARDSGMISPTIPI
jgi:hypothetical protein